MLRSNSILDVIENALTQDEINALLTMHNFTSEEAIRIQTEFSDLVLKLDQRDVQSLVRSISYDTLLDALTYASDEILTKIYTNLSKRHAQTIREDISYRPPLHINSVLEARRFIIKTY